MKPHFLRNLGFPKKSPFTHTFANDQIGLRQAIVPIYNLSEKNGISGLGTGFRVEGCDDYITAEHLVDVRKLKIDAREAQSEEIYIGDRFLDNSLCVVRWFDGIIGGTIDLPPENIEIVIGMRAPIREKDNPISALKGEVEFCVDADVAFLQTERPRSVHKNDFVLPISSSLPTVGDWVAAIGYPNVDISNYGFDENRKVLFREETYCIAYGQITSMHMRGKNQFLTPIIEIKTNWPSGMSGGPVLNLNGEVIGVVSSSIYDEKTDSVGVGVGFATLFLDQF